MCDFKTFIAVLKKCYRGAVIKVSEEESIAPVQEIYFFSALPINRQFACYLWQMLKLLLHRSPSKILGNWKLR